MTPKEIFFHPTICTLPWVGIYLGPSGDIRNCSISKTKLGNIKEATLFDIVQSDKNVKIKQQLLEEKKIAECLTCWNTENLQRTGTIGASNRIHFNKSLTKHVNTSIFDSAENFNLKMVDLRWRNTCNLACVYCGDDLSSTWALELGTKNEYDELAIEKIKDTVFNNIENIEYVYLCGGEPLLMKENSELIDVILEKKPNIFVRINTNLTNLSSPIYKKILKLKNVHWIVSVDSAEENFNFIRYGANWSSWLSNLKQLKSDTQRIGHKITFNMVWCAPTAFSIFDAIDCFLNLGFHSNSIFVQVIQVPNALKIQQLNQKSYRKLFDMISFRLQSLKENSWLKTGYNMMLAELEKPTNHDSTEFVKFIKVLDQRRGTNGLALFENLF